MALLIPALVLVIGLMVAGFRIWFARAALAQAAEAAARAATISRSAGEAQRDARSAATNSLSGAGLKCVPLKLELDLAGFRLPPGSPAAVAARVTCAARLSDIGLPGLPSVLSLQEGASSALDTYRGRR